jgi:hypothetical protein
MEAILKLLNDLYEGSHHHLYPAVRRGLQSRLGL